MLIKELLDNNIIRVGESINYEKINQIRLNGYSNISEYDFAEMLGINNTNFNNVKNGGQNAIILKSLIPMYEEKISKEILTDLLIEYKPGQSIDYSCFCKLLNKYSSIYKEITESKLGSFLELNDDSLYRLRKGKNVFILKSKFNSEDIIKLLIEQNVVYPGQKINYDEFLKIYETSKKLCPNISHFTKNAFSVLLKISKTSFYSMKSTPSYAIVLKNYIEKKENHYIMSDEERTKIVKNLMNTKGAFPYEVCDYTRFKKLYQGYENISKCDFAYILNISSTKFYKMKNSGEKEKILKDFLDKEKIISDLLLSGKLYIGQKINSIEYDKLYEEYNYLSKKVFSDILELTTGMMNKLYYDSNYRTTVFRSRIPKTKIESKNVQKINNKKLATVYVANLFDSKQIYTGKEIDYEFFKKIYFSCDYLSQREFASLIGISSFDFQNIKYEHRKTYIHNPSTLEAVKLIGDIERQRFYTIDEINEICKEYNITKQDFIKYIFYKKNSKVDAEPYIEILNSHSKLYIGRTKMSNEYFLKMQPVFDLPIKRLVGSMCKKYNQLRNIEDFTSEAFLYIFEKCGDIEKNSYDTKNKEVILYMILARVRNLMLSKLSKELKLQSKQKSTIYHNSGQKYEHIIPDTSKNIEEEAIDRVVDDSMEDNIMCELMCGFENGINKTKLLNDVQLKFNISEKELFELLKKRIKQKENSKEKNDKEL